MAFFINPVEAEQCVFLSYEGEMPPREFASARYEAQGLLKTRRWSRIVVDVTQLQSVPTPPQLFDFAKGLAVQAPRDARVALVIRPEQVRQANLVEKVARKDGVFLTYFLDPDRAVHWVKRTKDLRRPAARHPHRERQETS